MGFQNGVKLVAEQMTFVRMTSCSGSFRVRNINLHLDNFKRTLGLKIISDTLSNEAKCPYPCSFLRNTSSTYAMISLSFRSPTITVTIRSEVPGKIFSPCTNLLHCNKRSTLRTAVANLSLESNSTC